MVVDSDFDEELTDLNVAKEPLSESERRSQMIQEELNQIVQEAVLELEEELEQEALDALKIAAKKITYLKRYYDVLNDKIIYFPSVAKTIINYALFEEAEKYYYYKDDEFPMDYSLSLRTVVFDKLEEQENDEDHDTIDEEVMERLATNVEFTEAELEELRKAEERYLLQISSPKVDGTIVYENDDDSSYSFSSKASLMEDNSQENGTNLMYGDLYKDDNDKSDDKCECNACIIS